MAVTDHWGRAFSCQSPRRTLEGLCPREKGDSMDLILVSAILRTQWVGASAFQGHGHGLEKRSALSATSGKMPEGTRTLRGRQCVA